MRSVQPCGEGMGTYPIFKPRRRLRRAVLWFLGHPSRRSQRATKKVPFSPLRARVNTPSITEGDWAENIFIRRASRGLHSKRSALKLPSSASSNELIPQFPALATPLCVSPTPRPLERCQLPGLHGFRPRHQSLLWSEDSGNTKYRHCISPPKINHHKEPPPRNKTRTRAHQKRPQGPCKAIAP